MNYREVVTRLNIIRLAAITAELCPGDDDAAYEAAYETAAEEAEAYGLMLTVEHLRVIARTAVELRQGEED